MSASLIAAAPGAQATPSALEIEVRCAKLSHAERDELDARLRLLIATSQGAPSRLELHCDERTAWVVWSGTRLEVAPGDPLTDQFLDVIEQHLKSEHEAQEKADAALANDHDAAAVPSKAAPAGNGSEGTGPHGAAALRTLRPSGGLALGVELEPGSGSLEASAGPQLEFAIPLTARILFGSPLLVSGVEAARVSWTADYSLLFLDFGAGLGFGAPLARGARFGAEARFEAEWMIAYPSGTSAQAEFAPTGVLGLRVAHDFGWSLLWAEVAGRKRFSELEFRGAHRVEVASLVAQFTIGVAFLDQSPH